MELGRSGRGSWCLELEAWSLGLSFRHYAVKLLLSPCIAYAILYNILDGGKYESCLIYSFINFLCLALPYLRSGRALIFFKISFCLVFAITYIFNFFIPAISTI